ncbi:hypothetical protein JZ751_015471 [Albula glossodonta]|uniref:Uncharacterized protein n=1 Tax=Albula glossodonta TaxID=121402 RepID=A0A8T2N3K8_9TELE|nr:hypothetical protein JZ751_015471 [Albula glossodonta]
MFGTWKTASLTSYLTCGPMILCSAQAHLSSSAENNSRESAEPPYRANMDTPEFWKEFRAGEETLGWVVFGLLSVAPERLCGTFTLDMQTGHGTLIGYFDRVPSLIGYDRTIGYPDRVPWLIGCDRVPSLIGYDRTIGYPDRVPWLIGCDRVPSLIGYDRTIGYPERVPWLIGCDRVPSLIGYDRTIGYPDRVPWLIGCDSVPSLIGYDRTIGYPDRVPWLIGCDRVPSLIGYDRTIGYPERVPWLIGCDRVPWLIGCDRVPSLIGYDRTIGYPDRVPWLIGYDRAPWLCSHAQKSVVIHSLTPVCEIELLISKSPGSTLALLPSIHLHPIQVKRLVMVRGHPPSPCPTDSNGLLVLHTVSLFHRLLSVTQPCHRPLDYTALPPSPRLHSPATVPSVT